MEGLLRRSLALGHYLGRSTLEKISRRELAPSEPSHAVLTTVLLCAVGERQHHGEHRPLLSAKLDGILRWVVRKYLLSSWRCVDLIDLLQIVESDWPS